MKKSGKPPDDNKEESVMLKEYIYNGESEEELKEKLKNIFGESCLYERCKYGVG